MAQNVTIAGAQYSNVPAVDVPKTGGGTARFYDVSGTENITENGTYDVTTKASVAVNVDYPYPLFCPSDYSDGMQTSEGRDFCCEVAS